MHRTTSRHRSDDLGISAISLAVILPIILTLTLGAMDLFLYFRALNVVQRAAAEAAQTLAASSPGIPGEFSSVSIPKGEALSINDTVSGGGSTVDNANSSLYGPAGSGSPSTYTDVPFQLSSGRMTDTTVTYDGVAGVVSRPNVMYLPFVTVYTCLEPINDRLVTGNLNSAYSTCGNRSLNEPGTTVSYPNRMGNLTYELPSKMDFDGDGADDLVFYQASPNGLSDTTQWWVIPSSTGTLFRYAMQYSLGDTQLNFGGPPNMAIPCPADYDGDGMTDFCIAYSINGSFTTLDVRFSSKHYGDHNTFTLANTSTDIPLPVPGPWDNSGKDRFAIISSQVTTTNDDRLKTIIWPAFTDNNTLGPNKNAFSLVGAVTTKDSWSDKPGFGRNWRPAFSDHDGDGLLDIGWLTWEGGNYTSHVAGTGTAGMGPNAGVATLSHLAGMAPWKLFYPLNATAAGLFVVETSNHRVSLITPGDDGALRGNRDNEWYHVIAGGNAAGTTAATFENLPTPDPLGMGALGAVCVSPDGWMFPSPDSYGCGNTGLPDEPCPSCWPGGSFSGGIGAANAAGLDNPKDVYTKGGAGDFLFIADYGNTRVRVVNPGAGNYVNGALTETIFTLAGGGPGFTSAWLRPNCDPAGNTAYIDGGPYKVMTTRLMPPYPWTDFEFSSGSNFTGVAGTADEFMHPGCAMVRPISLAMDPTNNILFIGGEMGVIYAVYPGSDGTFSSAEDDVDTEDTMSILAGSYGQWSTADPTSTGGKLGFPVAMQMYEDPSGPDRLVVVLRYAQLPGSADPSPGTASADPVYFSKVIEIVAPTAPGNFTFDANGQIVTTGVTVRVIAGSMSGTITDSYRPLLYGDASVDPTGNIRNIGDMVLYKGEYYGTNRTAGMFTTSWWKDPNCNTCTRYGNALLNIYSRAVFTYATAVTPPPILPLPQLRWLNNRSMHAFGQMEPTRPDGTWNYSDFDFDNSEPLATLPVKPGAGVALSPDGRFLYFSQTDEGTIMAVDLNQDGDELKDLMTQISGGSNVYDLDRDGDGNFNASDDYPYHHDVTGSVRTMDTNLDPVVWATGLDGTIEAGGSQNRREWWLDRFGIVSNYREVPPSLAEEPPFRLLNRNTIAVSAPLEAMHSWNIYGGGFDLDNEGTAPNFEKAPIILGSNAPSESSIKDLSGYIHGQATWNVDDVKTLARWDAVWRDGIPRTNTGTPQTFAGLDIGMRRAHPVRCTGMWNPFMDSDNSTDEIVFLDWNGDGVRDPAIFDITNTLLPDNRPLMVHIGKLTDGGTSIKCPADWAAGASMLGSPDLWEKLRGQTWSPGTWNGDEAQYKCAYDTTFFSNEDSASYVSIMADMHAEWKTGRADASVDYDSQESNRLKTDVAGGNVGAVAEAAYRVLERTLKGVVRKDNPQYANEANVSIGNPDANGVVAVTVSYRFNFLSILGMERVSSVDGSVLLSKTIRRRLYNFGRSES